MYIKVKLKTVFESDSKADFLFNLYFWRTKI